MLQSAVLALKIVNRHALDIAEARHCYNHIINNIDEVINIVRSSKTTAIAKERLMERFGLDDPQAQAIVDMRLRALTGLEREKLDSRVGIAPKFDNYAHSLPV